MESDWSVPEKEVFRSIGEILDDNRRAVLATVVSIEGSAYRRPGAKMIIPEDGVGIGSITAGCLEDEVFELGRSVLEEGRPRVEQYDLMSDNDIWGLGLGCNGIIDVLLEPLDEDYRPAVEAFQERRPIAILKVLSSEDIDPDTRLTFDHQDGFQVQTGSLPDWLRDALQQPVKSLIEHGSSETVQVEGPSGETRVYIEGIAPPPELNILGSGPDVGPLAEVAGKNDFLVTVVGFRGGQDLEEMFPHADRHVTTTPAQLGQELRLDSRSYPVVMTHNYVDDRVALLELVESDVPYIGLMGPGERFENMLDDYSDPEEQKVLDALERIYTPIGLNLGGGSPYQIALSIVAEILTVHNDRQPMHLKEHEGPIHRRLSPSEQTEVEIGSPSPVN